MTGATERTLARVFMCMWPAFFVSVALLLTTHPKPGWNFNWPLIFLSGLFLVLASVGTIYAIANRRGKKP